MNKAQYKNLIKELAAYSYADYMDEWYVEKRRYGYLNKHMGWGISFYHGYTGYGKEGVDFHLIEFIPFVKFRGYLEICGIIDQ